MVEIKRFELLTPCVQSRCSPSWAKPPYACLFFALLRCCSVNPMLTYLGMLRFVFPRAPCTAKKILRILRLIFTLLRCYSVEPMLTYIGTLRFVRLRAPCIKRKILRFLHFHFSIAALLLGWSDAHVLRYVLLRFPSRALRQTKNPALLALYFSILLRI